MKLLVYRRIANLHSHAGFTLIEVLVVLALAAILAVLAAPSFNRLIASTRLSAQTTEMLSALQYVRSEALKRNLNVSICHSAAPADAAPTCSAAANGWASGWLVFTDGGTAGELDGTDQLLRVGQPATAMTFDVPPRYNHWLGFSSTGRPRAAGAGNGTISICNGELRRQLVISRAGRIRLDDTLANNVNCGAP